MIKDYDYYSGIASKLWMKYNGNNASEVFDAEVCNLGNIENFEDTFEKNPEEGGTYWRKKDNHDVKCWLTAFGDLTITPQK